MSNVCHFSVLIPFKFQCKKRNCHKGQLFQLQSRRSSLMLRVHPNPGDFWISQELPFSGLLSWLLVSQLSAVFANALSSLDRCLPFEGKTPRLYEIMKSVFDIYNQIVNCIPAMNTFLIYYFSNKPCIVRVKVGMLKYKHYGCFGKP